MMCNHVLAKQGDVCVKWGEEGQWRHQGGACVHMHPVHIATSALFKLQF